MTDRPPAAGTPITEAQFRLLARRGLTDGPSPLLYDPRTGKSWGNSDFDLNPELLADLAVMDPPRPAAVLVPIVVRERLSVLFTQRSAALRNHSGQIAFPGGRQDETDAGPIDTALREAEEEIGLPRANVEPLGFLDSYRTGTGYHIDPVVAFVRPPEAFALHEGEVTDVFEVPLEFLLERANFSQHTREWRGRHRAFWAVPYGERYIWGATAGMMMNMIDRLLGR